MGRDVSNINGLKMIFRFQSTRPHGARQAAVCSDAISVEFQSTRPHGARLLCSTIKQLNRRFNPRARMGRDQGATNNDYGFVIVSIHAPAWGATNLRGYLVTVSDVSIHAPAWGATLIPLPCWMVGRVSIHAPAWGATDGLPHLRHPSRVSIHAPAWGATLGVGASQRGGRVSIHAPAWGATRGFLGVADEATRFNPRARMGRDRSG